MGKREDWGNGMGCIETARAKGVAIPYRVNDAPGVFLREYPAWPCGLGEIPHDGPRQMGGLEKVQPSGVNAALQSSTPTSSTSVSGDDGFTPADGRGYVIAGEYDPVSNRAMGQPPPWPFAEYAYALSGHDLTTITVDDASIPVAAIIDALRIAGKWRGDR